MKYLFNTDLAFAEDIFFTKFKVQQRNPLDKDIIDIEYIHNSYGYRSKEFESNAEILSLGCSFTHGDGLPDNFIWPNLLANNLNMSVHNLAQGGDSAYGQMRKAFYYFKKFGNPKIISAIFPLYRMPIPSYDGKNLSFNYKSPSQKSSVIIQNCNMLPGKMEKFAKHPFDPEEVLSPEVAMFYTHSAIDILQQYCDSNGIVFVWNIWEKYDEIYDHYFKTNKVFYKDYCDLRIGDWNFNRKNKKDEYLFNKNMQCHLEYFDHPLYHIAADTKHSFEGAHWGIHRNIHIAESMELLIKEKIYNKNG
jgi:hypothetical protein